MSLSLPEFKEDPPRIIVPTNLTALLKQGFTICMRISSGRVIETYVKKTLSAGAPLQKTKVKDNSVFEVQLEEEPLELMKEGFLLEVCISPTSEIRVTAQKHMK